MEQKVAFTCRLIPYRQQKYLSLIAPQAKDVRDPNLDPELTDPDEIDEDHTKSIGCSSGLTSQPYL